ncbi:17157_t:CDS:2, partial [Dentiscutata erythropus]
MPSVSVKVVLSDRKEILNWQIHPVIGNPSLCKFFHLLATGEISPEVFINNNYHDFVLRVKVGNLLKDEFINVNIQYNLNEILQTIGNFVLFELLIPEDYQPPIQKEKMHLENLYIIEWIRNNGRARAIYPPKEFEEFFNRLDLSSYKNARPQFDYDCVNRYANLLFGHLNMPWIEKSQFNWLFPLLEKFSNCLIEYSTYLNEQNIEISKNHQLEFPVRSLDDSISIKIYDGTSFFSSPQTKSNYESLNNKLSTLSYWKVLDIEPFVPSKP